MCEGDCYYHITWAKTKGYDKSPLITSAPEAASPQNPGRQLGQ